MKKLGQIYGENRFICRLSVSPDIVALPTGKYIVVLPNCVMCIAIKWYLDQSRSGKLVQLRTVWKHFHLNPSTYTEVNKSLKIHGKCRSWMLDIQTSPIISVNHNN